MNGFRTIRSEGTFELTVQKSRFIGQCFRAETEQEAVTLIESVRKRFYDAKHHCYAYCAGDGMMITRCSDDGEPSGTAGVPILNVLRQKELRNTVCVVTRYFGGVLLGTGGLFRAYTKSAKDALEDAGRSAVRRWVAMDLPCSYSALERYKQELAAYEGVAEDLVYGAEVVIRALLPEEKAEAFRARIFDLSGGTVQVRVTGESHRAVPIGYS